MKVALFFFPSFPPSLPPPPLPPFFFFSSGFVSFQPPSPRRSLSPGEGSGFFRSARPAASRPGQVLRGCRPPPRRAPASLLPPGGRGGSAPLLPAPAGRWLPAARATPPARRPLLPPERRLGPVRPGMLPSTPRPPPDTAAAAAAFSAPDVAPLLSPRPPAASRLPALRLAPRRKE